MTVRGQSRGDTHQTSHAQIRLCPMQPPPGPSMVHAAMLYSTPAEATARLLPMLRDAIAREHAVLVRLDEQKINALQRGLGEDAHRITFVDPTARYGRPAQAIDALSTFIGAMLVGGTTLVHAIGELVHDGDEVDTDWVRYEAAVNDVFATAPLRATCLYPRDLPARVLDAVGRTHPHVDTRQGLSASVMYRGAEAACAQLPATRLAPAREPDLCLTGVADPRRARAGVSNAVGNELRTTAADSLAVVVSELVTNSILHGGGAADVELWCEPASLVLRVRDDGPGIRDPFAGLRPPDFPRRGAGLWVAHHLCDRVAIECPPAGGAVVTARLDLNHH
jgi:anti-sigma regulatory factor (Ser/Thr protein kinase)